MAEYCYWILAWFVVGFITANIFHWTGRKIFDKIDWSLVAISFLLAPFAFCSAIAILLEEIGVISSFCDFFERIGKWLVTKCKRFGDIKNPYHKGK